MYHIRMTEDGVFKTVIGGPIATIAVAVDQIKALCLDSEWQEMAGYVGCMLDRYGVNRILWVCDDFGQPIKSIDKEEG